MEETTVKPERQLHTVDKGHPFTLEATISLVVEWVIFINTIRKAIKNGKSDQYVWL
jgi:hypothetical protein